MKRARASCRPSNAAPDRNFPSTQSPRERLEIPIGPCARPAPGEAGRIPAHVIRRIQVRDRLQAMDARAQLLDAPEGGGEEAGRRPGHAGEQRGSGRAKPDEMIPAVRRRTQDHVGPSQRQERLREPSGGEARRVAADDDDAPGPAAERPAERPRQPLAQVRPFLQHDGRLRIQPCAIRKRRAGGIRDRDADARQAPGGCQRVMRQASVELRGLLRRKPRAEPGLDPAWNRGLDEDQHPLIGGLRRHHARVYRLTAEGR